MRRDAENVLEGSGAKRDPVCKMEIEEGSASGSIKYEGTTYLFCSANCLEKFRADPWKYLPAPIETSAEVSKPHRSEQVQKVKPETGGDLYTCPMHPEVRHEGPGTCPECGMALEPKAAPFSGERVEYVCPMHPEVVSGQPGTCPKCGMALEPKTVFAEEEENPELRDMRRRFWVSVVLALPLLFVAMGEYIPGNPLSGLISPRIKEWIELILGTPVVLWCGRPFFVRAWQSLVNRSLNMFTLIGMGVGVAYLYSVVAVLFPDIFPPTFREREAG